MFEFMHHTLIISTTIYYYCRFMPQQQTTTWTNRAQFSLESPPQIDPPKKPTWTRQHPNDKENAQSCLQTIGTTTLQQKNWIKKRCMSFFKKSGVFFFQKIFCDHQNGINRLTTRPYSPGKCLRFLPGCLSWDHSHMQCTKRCASTGPFRWIRGGVEVKAQKSYYCINIYVILLYLLRTQVSMRFQ